MKALSSAPFIIFVVLLAATAALFGVFDVEHHREDFFQRHGILFLIFITLFPRLTLIFSSVSTGGILWWLGWLFYPRVLVAVLATIYYIHTNPILVTISWAVALSGEFAEKKGITANKRFIVRTYGPADFAHGPRDIYEPQIKDPGQGEVIEAEFTKKD